MYTLCHISHIVCQLKTIGLKFDNLIVFFHTVLRELLRLLYFTLNSQIHIDILIAKFDFPPLSVLLFYNQVFISRGNRSALIEPGPDLRMEN